MDLDNQTVTAPVETEAASIDDLVVERRERREAEASAEVVEADDAPDAPDDGAGDKEQGVDAPDETEAVEESAADDGEPNDEANPVEDDEPTAPAVEPPTFYNAEQREHFATLDPVSQANVSQLVRAGQAHVSRLVNEARTEARNAVRTKLEQFDAAVDVAETTFGETFATDAELSQLIATEQLSPADAYQHQLKRAAAEAKLTQLRDARESETQIFLQESQRARQTELQERNPQVLADAGDVVRFLNERGIASEQIDWAGSQELEVAWMAMKWAKSQTAAKSVKRRAKPPAKVVKPAKGRPATSQNSDALAKLKRRADATGSVEDMVAYRKAARRASRQ